MTVDKNQNKALNKVHPSLLEGARVPADSGIITETGLGMRWHDRLGTAGCWPDQSSHPLCFWRIKRSAPSGRH